MRVYSYSEFLSYHRDINAPMLVEHQTPSFEHAKPIGPVFPMQEFLGLQESQPGQFGYIQRLAPRGIGFGLFYDGIYQSGLYPNSDLPFEAFLEKSNVYAEAYIRLQATRQTGDLNASSNHNLTGFELYYLGNTESPLRTAITISKMGLELERQDPQFTHRLLLPNHILQFPDIQRIDQVLGHWITQHRNSMTEYARRTNERIHQTVHAMPDALKRVYYRVDPQGNLFYTLAYPVLKDMLHDHIPPDFQDLSDELKERLRVVYDLTPQSLLRGRSIVKAIGQGGFPPLRLLMTDTPDPLAQT